MPKFSYPAQLASSALSSASSSDTSWCTYVRTYIRRTTYLSNYLTLGIARRGAARFIPALVGVMLLLTSCDSPPTLAAGVVTGKSHTDAWAYSQSIPCGNGCAYAITNLVPEKWTLHLKDDGKTGDHDVSAQEYFKYQVGEWYPR